MKKNNSAVNLHAIFVKGNRGRLDTSPRGWGVRSELVPEMQSDDLMEGGGGRGSSEDGGGRGVDVGGRFEYPGSITNMTPGNLVESEPAPENEAQTKFTPTKANHSTYHKMPSSQLHYSSKMPDPVTERESEQFQPTTLRDRSPLTPSPQTPSKTDISDLKQQIRDLKSENNEIGQNFTLKLQELTSTRDLEFQTRLKSNEKSLTENFLQIIAGKDKILKELHDNFLKIEKSLLERDDFMENI